MSSENGTPFDYDLHKEEAWNNTNRKRFMEDGEPVRQPDHTLTQPDKSSQWCKPLASSLQTKSYAIYGKNDQLMDLIVVYLQPGSVFLAVQNSSIGDVVSESVTFWFHRTTLTATTPMTRETAIRFKFRLRAIQWLSDLVTQLTITDKLQNLNHDIEE